MISSTVVGYPISRMNRGIADMAKPAEKGHELYQGKVKLLTEEQVHEWFGIPIATLQSMRSRPGKDPIPFTKIGRLIRYREDLLLKWIERNTFDDTEQSKEARGTG